MRKEKLESFMDWQRNGSYKGIMLSLLSKVRSPPPLFSISRNHCQQHSTTVCSLPCFTYKTPIPFLLSSNKEHESRYPVQSIKGRDSTHPFIHSHFHTCPCHHPSLLQPFSTIEKRIIHFRTDFQIGFYVSTRFPVLSFFLVKVPF